MSYEMTMSLGKAAEMTARFSKFHYGKKSPSFLSSFFGEIIGRGYPLMDIPFYIMSLEEGNMPKELNTFLGENKKRFMEDRQAIVKHYSDAMAAHLGSSKTEYMTIKEIADILRLGSRTVRQVLHKKNVPMYVPSKVTALVASDDFNIFMESCRTERTFIKTTNVVKASEPKTEPTKAEDKKPEENPVKTEPVKEIKTSEPEEKKNQEVKPDKALNIQVAPENKEPLEPIKPKSTEAMEEFFNMDVSKPPTGLKVSKPENDVV